MIPYPRTLKPDPEGVILDIFSRKPGITAKKSYEFFLEKYGPGMSLQGFYKLVRKMLRDRILVKNEGLLALDISWVNNLIKFTGIVRSNYLDKGDESTIILEEGESSSFSFADVIEMDNFWDHALLSVIRYYETKKHSDKDIYSKNFYSWIQILRTQSSIELCNSYAEFGLNWYMSSGSHSFLNSLVPHLVTSENFHFAQYSDLEGYGKGSDNFHVTVIGDFIFETKLPPHLFDMVKEMFESTKNIAELDTAKVERNLQSPGKTVLTLTRNQKRAAEIREGIKRSFK